MKPASVTFSQAELLAAMIEWARRSEEGNWPDGARDGYAADCASYLAKLLAEQAEARADVPVSPAITATFVDLVEAFATWRAQFEAQGIPFDYGDNWAKLAADYLWSILEGMRSRAQAVQA